MTYTCPACGWSKTVAPRSDCLVRGLDVFDACPKCGHEPLEVKPANVVQAALAELAQKMQRVLR